MASEANLSNRLRDAGDTSAALDAIREAVRIQRRLAEAGADRSEPDLASNLYNLSNCLSDAGDTGAALEASREAVRIRRRLAEGSPDR